MPFITLEKPGVESARRGKLQSSLTGQPAGLGPHCAGAGAAPKAPSAAPKAPSAARKIQPQARSRRPQVGGARGCLGFPERPRGVRTSPPTPTQEAGLSPRHWHTYGVLTARAHKRQPTQEEGPGPLCPRLVRLYLMMHLALLFRVDIAELGQDGQQVDVADKW